MNSLFPHANIIAAILVFVIGFGLHWLGQLISVVNRPLAIKLGIWDREMLPEYAHFEHGIAMADAILGWIYGIAAIGLILDASWGYTLAWFPGVVFLYHSLSFWFWTENQRKAGYLVGFTKNPGRTIWFLANFTTGLLVIALAWTSN
jgi:hypothetical protein